MKNQQKKIRQEMYNLIARSCTFQSSENQYHSFQKTLLKFFFHAGEVNLDYQNNSIFLWTPSLTASSSPNLYGSDETISVKLSYTNLEETLKGCIENGRRQEQFYKTMLFFYNQVEEGELVDSLSA